MGKDDYHHSIEELRLVEAVVFVAIGQIRIRHVTLWMFYSCKNYFGKLSHKTFASSFSSPILQIKDSLAWL